MVGFFSANSKGILFPIKTLNTVLKGFQVSIEGEKSKI